MEDRKPLLNVKFRRNPRDHRDRSDADPPDLLRREVLARVEQHVLAVARPPEALRFHGDDWVEEGALEVDTTPETEPLLAALFRKSAAREGVRRAFRVGELRIRREGARPRRAAGVLELDPAGADGEEPVWWFAYRFIGVGKDEIGVLHGEWVASEGTGCAALIEAARPWLEASAEQLEAIVIERNEMPAPRPFVRAAVGDLAEPLPADARDVASLAGDMVHRDALAGFVGVIVLVFHEHDVERWEIRGNLECSLDDLVRAIAAHSSAEAVALVQPALVELGEGDEAERRRAMTALAERDGHRFVHIRTLSVTPEGITDGGLAVVQDCGEPGEDGWIGVEPTASININFTPDDPVPGGVVPEG